MRITEEERQERREMMIQTAFRLFCNYGIESVSMSEIAKKAQVGENTLYRYFNTKGKLVLAAFVKLWDTIMHNVESVVENVPDYDDLTGYEQMRIWIRGFQHLHKEDKEFVLFSYEAKLYLLRQNIKMDISVQDILMHTVRDSCLKALNKGKEDGSIPVKENSEDLFYAIWGYIVKIVIYGELYGEDSPWEKRYEMMEKGILSALHSGWNAP